MGSAGSVNPAKVVEVDDEFGEDVESSVTKRIPIEYPPGRKSTSLRTTSSSFGKKKSRRSTRSKPIINSISLRSVFSIADQETEADQVRREFEEYRQKRLTEIAELEVRKEKLHSENQRLRGEIKALQVTCLKLKNERAMALEGKEQALQRAATFEKGNNIILSL